MRLKMILKYRYCACFFFFIKDFLERNSFTTEKIVGPERFRYGEEVRSLLIYNIFVSGRIRFRDTNPKHFEELYRLDATVRGSVNTQSVFRARRSRFI